MPLLPGAGWSPAGIPASWACLVLFCFVEFQFAAFLVRLFRCGGCESQEGPCRPGSQEKCVPTATAFLWCGISSAQGWQWLLKAATSLAGDAKNQLMLVGFFNLFPVLADISVDNNQGC